MHVSLKKIQIRKIVKILKKEFPNLQVIYLFGSFAEKKSNQKSDIDIAFLSSNKTDSFKIFRAQEKTASILAQDIDLINLKETSTV
ncbi:nucleotidyltransferase domain-containing protein, partial [Candidatus Nomurabacteria bacterium]|nr:nucleotidyltransferase domain-containing protein [Candidatus Nomurabacteria bacterium]